jgi:hypothetical protein
MRSLALVAISVSSTAAHGAPRAAADCSWSAADIAGDALRPLLRARGLQPPARFRALVVETQLSADRRRIVRHRLHDWGKLSSEPSGWNPASTVKLYSAISALEQVRSRRFGVGVKVTFHYPQGARSFALGDLFEDAVHWSKNVPHNRLVELAGFDFLNGTGGTLRRAGLEHSYVMAAYGQRAWIAEGRSPSLRASPRITLEEGRRRRTIPERRSSGRYPCGSSACTTLSDLAKTMCRMMLHEQLPREKRLKLGGDRQSAHLKLLRQAMERKRRGKHDPVWDAMEQSFPPRRGYLLFRKAGFSQDWLSENVFVYHRRSRVRWIVTLAAHGGRDCLTQAARAVARLILDGALSAHR